MPKIIYKISDDLITLKLYYSNIEEFGQIFK